jgi:hypothetical protein
MGRVKTQKPDPSVSKIESFGFTWIANIALGSILFKRILTLRKGIEENLKDCDDPEDIDIIHIELYLLKR